MAAGTATADELKKAGFGDLLGQETYGTDLSGDLSLGSKATAQNVASRDQVAKLNALAKLGGTEAFGDESQAGSYKEFNTDLDRAKARIASAKADYDALSNQTQGQINNANQGMAKAIQGLGEGERNLLAKSFGYTGDPANWTAKNALIAQKLEERYGGLSPDQQKIMRESGEYGFEVDNPGYQPNSFGNSSIFGAPKTYNFNPLQNSAVRDAFTSAYSQKQAQQAALQQLRDKYKIGSKFGG